MEHETRPDAKVLESIAAGDEDALAELYDRYGRLAYGLALRVLGDRALAEDAVQEAFLAVWRTAGRYDETHGSARAWVLMIVHRRAVDVVRSRRHHSHRLLEPARQATESAEETAWTTLERRRVQQALEQLPPRQRRFLELAYYGGFTQSEIAARLEVPLGTVKSSTSTALSRLRSMLADEDPADVYSLVTA